VKKWKKIIINKSNRITKINKIKNFKYFCEEDSENYGNVDAGYDSNRYYQNKELFFEFYLKGKFLIWDKYLKKNLHPNTKILSIASGRGINELSLISNNFNVTCSDIEIPKCYEKSKKLFGNFNYINFNILTDTINEEFDSIYAISVFYIFSYSELEKIFYKINKILKKDGIFILDLGGSEYNLISFFFHEVYLVIEAYIIYYLSKLLNKKIGLKVDNNFGYRRTNREVIKLANQFGFELIDLNEYDYLNELKRSILITKIIKFFPFSKKFFIFFGQKLPCIRMFKFKKTP